jgi:hypothetical protein
MTAKPWPGRRRDPPARAPLLPRAHVQGIELAAGVSFDTCWFGDATRQAAPPWRAQG